MSNKDLLFKIAKHASIVEMHIQRLKKKPDEIHEIDIDMLTEKLKDLYLLVFELETGKAIKEIPDAPVVNIVEKPPLVEVKTEPEMPEPKAPEMKSDTPETTDKGPEVVVEPDLETKPPPRPTPRTPDLESEARSPEPESESHPEAQTPNPEPPKTTADLFTGATTIADSFQSEEDTSIAARVVPPAVEDLKMAIGINDKFLFINELFKGSPSDYNEAIEKLNSSDALPNAETTLNTYRSQYEWSDQSEAYNRLKKIVIAKYRTS